MLGKTVAILCITALIFAVFCGKLPLIGNAVLDGAQSALSLTLALCPAMCLFCGIMSAFERAGAVGFLCRLLSPVLRLIYPGAFRGDTGGREEIAASVSANLLGLGNAATPLALKAMCAMQEKNPRKDTATDDMATFTVMSTAPLNLLPTTLIALRRAAGSDRPYLILPAVFICSAACSVFAAVLCRGLCTVKGVKGVNGVRDG